MPAPYELLNGDEKRIARRGIAAIFALMIAGVLANVGLLVYAIAGSHENRWIMLMTGCIAIHFGVRFAIGRVNRNLERRLPMQREVENAGPAARPPN